MLKVFAVIDNQAQNIVGNMLTIHRHEAPAIRQFTDLLSDERSMLNKHPHDFDLVQMGEIDEDTMALEPRHAIILKGSAWAASNAPQLVKEG